MRKIEWMIPASFTAAAAALGLRSSRALGGNTTLARVADDAIEVRLYGTPVATFYRDGTIGLATGGHITVTTASRMNAALRNTNVRVCRRAGAMMLRTIGCSRPFAEVSFGGLVSWGATGAPFVHVSRAHYLAECRAIAAGAVSAEQIEAGIERELDAMLAEAR